MASRAKKKREQRAEQALMALLVFGCNCGGRWGQWDNPHHELCFREAAWAEAVRHIDQLMPYQPRAGAWAEALGHIGQPRAGL